MQGKSDVRGPNACPQAASLCLDTRWGDEPRQGNFLTKKEVYGNGSSNVNSKTKNRKLEKSKKMQRGQRYDKTKSTYQGAGIPYVHTEDGGKKSRTNVRKDGRESKPGTQKHPQIESIRK